MKIIIGLGNPGATYRNTRHNVGMRVVEVLAERHAICLKRRLFEPHTKQAIGRFGDYRRGGESVRLILPQVYMNESGRMLGFLNLDFASPHHLPGFAAGKPPLHGSPTASRQVVGSQNLLIVCDDANLPLGVIRLRSQGSAGGHLGLLSCLEALGTQRVARLRFGIGRADLPRDLRSFVLEPFDSEEEPLVAQSLSRAMEAAEVWVSEGISVAMNRYNINFASRNLSTESS